MVYIARDGRVLERRPWDIQRVLEIFAAIWLVIVTFFNTLLAPFMTKDDDSSRSNTRRGGWGSGGGGGGGYGPGGGGGRGGGGGGSNRRIGRVVNTSMDCNIPGGG